MAYLFIMRIFIFVLFLSVHFPQLANSFKVFDLPPKGERITFNTNKQTTYTTNRQETQLNIGPEIRYFEADEFFPYSSPLKQLGKEISINSARGDFGSSVSLSSNGRIMGVGAPTKTTYGTASVYRYVYISRTSGSWVQLGEDIVGDYKDRFFGSEVSLSSDGYTIAIGARGKGSGSVRIYQYDHISESWIQFGNIINGEAENDFFGGSVSLSDDGYTVAIGAFGNDENGDNSGHVRVYNYDVVSGTWLQLGADINGEAEDDWSGYSVSLSANGSKVAIGAPESQKYRATGYVRIFYYDYEEGSWKQQGSGINDINGEGNFGTAVSLNDDGNLVAIGAGGYARIYSYDDKTGSWQQLGADLKGVSSVSLSADGHTVALGMPGTNYVSNGFTYAVDIGATEIYRYDEEADAWDQLGEKIYGDYKYDRSGSSVSLSADGLNVAIGSPQNDGRAVDVSGYVDVFSFGNIFPEAQDINVKTKEDTPIEFRLVGGDTDKGSVIYSFDNAYVDYMDDDIGTISLKDGKGIIIPKIGTNDTFTFIPRKFLQLPVQLYYTASNEVNTSFGKVNIFIEPVDNTPDDDIYFGLNYDNPGIVNHNKVQTFTMPSKDKDDEKLNYEIIKQPDLGSVIINNNIITYTPFEKSIGSDWFTYIVSDGTTSVKQTAHLYIRTPFNYFSVPQQLGFDVDGGIVDDSLYQYTSKTFAQQVSLSADGRTFAVGAEFEGYGGKYVSSGFIRIYRYVDESETWVQLGADLKGRVESVSLSADGYTVAIGDSTDDGNGNDSGTVRIYRYADVSNTWEQLGTDIEGEAEEDYSGRAISLSTDGNIVAIGAQGNDGNGIFSGHVRIYNYDDVSDSWLQLGADIDGEVRGDLSGYSVSLSSDGLTVAIGAPENDEIRTNSGHVRIYNYDDVSGSWIQLGADIDGEQASDRDSGRAVSLSSDGRTVAVMSPKNIRIFRYDGSSWVQLGADILASLSFIGLDLSADGYTIAATQYINNIVDSGRKNAVNIYSYDGHSWVQLDYTIVHEGAYDYDFGQGLSLSADGFSLAVGAPAEGISTNSPSGYVRVYSLGNELPVAQDIIVSTKENIPVEITLTSNNLYKDELIYTVDTISSNIGELTLKPSTNNTYIFTPVSNYHSDFIFYYTVSDGDGNSDTATVSVTMIPLDTDFDGLPDNCDKVCLELGTIADKDDDNDGIDDKFDAYPLISIGDLTDTDSDGAPDSCDESCVALGMAGDTDDDNDGVLDTADTYPLVVIGSLTDTDFDGAPDTCDPACIALGMAADTDDDNDGVLDTVDAYPFISISNLTDTDSDGAPDTCDESCVALGMAADTDDDNDGVLDTDDVFPLDTDKSTLLDDDSAPVVTAPADIYTTATGRLTPVELGQASVSDNLETLTAVANETGPFVSGQTDVEWSATDSAGNTGSSTQSVFITPLVTIPSNVTVIRGETVTIDIALSGEAVDYPVLIPISLNVEGINLSTNQLEILSGTDTSFAITVDAEVTQKTVTVLLSEPANAALSDISEIIIAINSGVIAPYTLLEQPTSQFASLTPTAKIIVTSSEGENFFDVAKYISNATTDNPVSVVGETFLISGSSDIDGFMVQPGVKYDLTNLKGGIDKLYFSGPLAEYADSILLDAATGVMQLSRLTDVGEEIVQFIATASAADTLIFTDGALSTADVKAAVSAQTPLTDLTLDTSIKALDDKMVTGATVKHIVLNSDGGSVMGLGPSIKTLISGNSGIDQIYVPAGSIVDASNLKSGRDEITLEGNLADYDITLDTSGNIVLSRDVVIDEITHTEEVTVANGGNVATNDLVIFADQELDISTIKQQL